MFTANIVRKFSKIHTHKNISTINNVTNIFDYYVKGAGLFFPTWWMASLYFSYNDKNTFDDFDLNYLYFNSYLCRGCMYMYFCLFVGAKTFILTSVYPLIICDTLLSYKNGRFYKQHLILDYRSSHAFHKYESHIKKLIEKSGSQKN